MVDGRKDWSCFDLYYHSKHVGTINHQLQKFTPLGLVSYLAVMYFGLQGEREQRAFRVRIYDGTLPPLPGVIIYVLPFSQELEIKRYNNTS